MGVTMHYSLTFYHQHRMAHLPTIYQHAHKLHHQLHGTTAFDATTFGWGMPEELVILPLELLLLAWTGLPPTMANLHVMTVSLGNKYGHVMLEGGAAIDNFHADHHVIHNKNFGAFHCLLDLYLGTCARPEGYRLQVKGNYHTRNRSLSQYCIRIRKLLRQVLGSVQEIQYSLYLSLIKHCY